MLRNKRILLTILVALLLLIIPNVVNADEENTVSYTRTFPDNIGTIIINLTGLELDDNKQYEFALVTKGGTPENWNLITDYDTTTARITLSPSTSNIVNVLKVTDNGQLFVREKPNTEESTEETEVPAYIVDRLNVNLKLPLLQSLAYEKDTKVYNIAKQLYGSIGNTSPYIHDDHTYSQWQKVDDEELVEKFLEIKNNNGSITSLENYLPACPITGYSSERQPNYTSKNDGLYLLWVKRNGESCKDVYSCIVHDGLPEATTAEEYLGTTEVEVGPKINKISATAVGSLTIVGNSPEYHPTVGDQVTITVQFDQDIVMDESPTLKIKFGTGSEKTLANATSGANSIEYKYTVTKDDLGVLQTISLSEGDITNNEGTQANLTLPNLSGTKIVAVASEDNEGTGENEDPVDTKLYVSFPWMIINGNGDVSLKSGVYEGTYSLAYQFVEVSQEEYDAVEALISQYENEEITYEEYLAQYKEAVTKYDDTKWVNTSDGSFTVDTSKFTGEKYFALWVKVEMEDKTVYEYQIYKMNGTASEEESKDDSDKDTNKEDDKTTADKDLPNTGANIAIAVTIVGMLSIAVIAFCKYNKLKGI